MTALQPAETLALRIPEACKAVGIGRSTIYRLAKERRIRFVRVAGRTLVPMSELRRLIEEAA